MESLAELGVGDGGFTIRLHYWDYVFFIVYAFVLLINLVGVAKYAIKAQMLTLMIMLFNVFATFCK